MSDPSHAPRSVDPDDVLGAHARALADEYRRQLSAAYLDPRLAYEVFRAEATRRGPGNAAIAMREQPGAFGALAEGGEAHARMAAEVAAQAYHARIAQRDPRLGADVLDQALTDALRSGNVDATRVTGTWEALSTAYGPDTAAAVFVRRAREILPPDTPPGAAARLATFAAARDHLRERAGLAAPLDRPSSRPLPRSLQDERDSPSPLPSELQARLVAASDALRRRLAAAYEIPLAAEARLHTLVSAEGIEGITRAERDPAALGTLRNPLPGWSDATDAAARSALAYARIAYAFDLSRAPDDAAERVALDQLQRSRMTARDPQRALDGVHEAAQLRGAELEAHLAQRRDRARSRGPDRGGPGDEPPAPGRDAGDPRAADAASAGRRASADPAVDEAVRAHEAMQEAQELNGKGRQLREERGSAERILARLDQQDDALDDARRELLAVAGAVYENPEAAVERWDRLVLREHGHLERARERLLEDPQLLGRLRTEPARGWRGALGLRSTETARDAVPRLATRATAFTRAHRAVTDPVQWTGPEGEEVHGRERVREAATGVLRDRQQRIDATDRRLQEIGGVRGTERAAQKALGGLSPAQSGKAAGQIAKRGGITVARAASMVRLSLEAGRVARSMSEGPAGL